MLLCTAIVLRAQLHTTEDVTQDKQRAVENSKESLKLFLTSIADTYSVWTTTTYFTKLEQITAIDDQEASSSGIPQHVKIWHPFAFMHVYVSYARAASLARVHASHIAS